MLQCKTPTTYDGWRLSRDVPVVRAIIGTISRVDDIFPWVKPLICTFFLVGCMKREPYRKSVLESIILDWGVLVSGEFISCASTVLNESFTERVAGVLVLTG